MLESSKQGSSSAYLLKALIVYSAEHGTDTAALLHSINFDAKLLEHEQARIHLSVFNQLWNEVSDVLRDPLLGLHFGEAFGRQGEGHFLFAIMKNRETLHSAIQSLIRFHGLMTDMVKPSLSVINGKARLELEYTFNNAAITRHLPDAVLSLLATVLRKITNDRIAFEKIYLSHPAADDPDEYTRIFGREPVFNSGSNCIVFDASELNRTFPLAHHEFGTQLQVYAEKLEDQLLKSEKFSDRIFVVLEKSILKGEDFSLKTVAGTFNMSIRHLQNKLKEEGFTYRTVLDKARTGIALHYLQDKEVMLCDIAFLLGFSEQSSFNHAFKKWTGSTPREYKEKISGNSGATPSKKYGVILGSSATGT